MVLDKISAEICHCDKENLTENILYFAVQRKTITKAEQYIWYMKCNEQKIYSGAEIQIFIE